MKLNSGKTISMLAQGGWYKILKYQAWKNTGQSITKANCTNNLDVPVQGQYSMWWTVISFNKILLFLNIEEWEWSTELCMNKRAQPLKRWKDKMAIMEYHSLNK